jgi:hypothetical protein
MRTTTSRGWGGFSLASLGVGWAAFLFVGTFVLPWSSTTSGRITDSVGGSGTMVETTRSMTLFAESGWAAVGAVSVPLLLALVVWFALRRRCTHGASWTDGVAWTIVGLLFLVSFITGFSVGPILVPLWFLLGAAAAITPEPSPAA